MRIIDDDKLLQLKREGKLQREMAEHFGVSEAAISKKLKRLTTPEPEPPESFKKLTEKEQKFVLSKVEGKTHTQAALDSFECGAMSSAKNIGSTLMKKEDINLAIAEIMRQEGVTRRSRIRKLKSHINAVDPHVSLKAMDQSWKLDGSYAAEKHINVDLDINAITDDLKKLEERRKRLRQELQGIIDPELLGEDDDDIKDL